MANTPSAIKCIRQIATRSENNRRNRSRMRTEVKKLHKALESKRPQGGTGAAGAHGQRPG